MGGSVLTSVRNPKIAAAARLKRRAYRDADRRFLVEGARAVGEAIGSEAGLESLFTVDGLDPVAVHAQQAGVDVSVVSPEVMGRLTSTVTPQGLVGIAPFLDRDLATVPVPGCAVVLHEVRDPGNAGTVLRSADAVGASAVVFAGSSVDVYNPKAVRASAGSLFHLPVVRQVSGAEALEQLRERGIRVLATDAAGSEDLYRSDLSGPVAFVFGNEATGLPGDVRDRADAVVRIPLLGAAESLNLAAAATVCLFEWTRRRRPGHVPLASAIGAAAHDLRSPLTALKGFGHALETRWEELSASQRALMLRGIVYDAERMDLVLRQLVDAARASVGRLEVTREPTDVPALVRDIADLLSRDPDHPAVAWVGHPLEVAVDPARLRTTIFAFVESAAWWGRTGAVEVHGVSSGRRFLLSVARAGTELSAAGAEQLFDAGTSAGGRERTIGLAVGRLVAEAQGGRAWADVVGHRLTLHLELPTR